MKARAYDSVLVGLIFVFVCFFYTWTTLPKLRGPVLSEEARDYYNLQASGLAKGKLSLDLEVDPELAALDNPWDPVQRAGRGLHDASYYNGEYHMYFGVGPAVVLFLPIQVLTGMGLNQSFAIVLFCAGGTAAALALLLLVRWRYFPGLSRGWLGLFALTVGLANMVPCMLRRPSIWEVPISGAYCFLMLGFVFGFLALHGRRPLTFLALMSASFGLMVAARPVQLFACVAVLVPTVALVRLARREQRSADLKRIWSAAVLPAFFIGLGLAAFNYFRFGSVIEFGQRYQLAGENVQDLTLFSWHYALYSARIYLWEPATWTPFFPFVGTITPPPGPEGHFGLENPYGMLTNIPFVWMAPLALVGVWSLLRKSEMRGIASTLATLAVAGVMSFCTVICFGGATNRYMVDFVPTAVLLAAMLAAFHFSAKIGSGFARRSAKVFAALAALFSITFNLLVSVQHNGLYKVEDPVGYTRLATWANGVGAWVNRVVGVRYGPLEMEIQFPAGTPGTIEPLVVTGATNAADYLYVIYQQDSQIQFALEHTSYGSTPGKTVTFVPGRTYRVRVDMGSLYPPEGHPFFARFNPREIDAIRRKLSVTLDGEEVLEGIIDFYDASADRPDVGNAGERPAFKEPFTGKILSQKRLPRSLPTPMKMKPGPVAITVISPPFTIARSEPLLSTGNKERGDIIYINYETENTFTLAHDCIGGGGRKSETITYDPALPLTFEIDIPSLYPARYDKTMPGGTLFPGEAKIKMNGKLVWAFSAHFHATGPDTMIVGRNTVGASGAAAAFGGQIREVTQPNP